MPQGDDQRSRGKGERKEGGADKMGTRERKREEIRRKKRGQF